MVDGEATPQEPTFEQDRDALRKIAGRRGQGWIVSTLAALAREQKARYNPNEGGQALAHHRGWEQDATTLDDVFRQLRH